MRLGRSRAAVPRLAGSVALVLSAAWTACLCGCGGSIERPQDLYQRLGSDDPAVRLQAVTEAGHRRDTRAVPLLVNRLEDDDSAVRMLALCSLRQITGQTFDYEFHAPLAQRQAAVERWRQWLAQGAPAAASAPTQGG